MTSREIGTFALTAVLSAGTAIASEGRVALDALAKRVSELERYSVKVSVSIFETEGAAKPATLMAIIAARDGDRYHYRNGPIEIVWAANRTVVVNHSARRIIVHAPHSGRSAPSAIQSATAYSVDGASGSSHVEQRSIDGKQTLVVEHEKGPVQRIAVQVNADTGLPAEAQITYRRGPRLPASVSMTYEWSTGSRCQCPTFDDQDLLEWEGGNARPHATLRNYHVVRLDRP